MEDKGLCISAGHQFGIQSCNSDWGVGEIPSPYAQRDSLHANGNTVRNFNCTKNFCEDNLSNNRQSERKKTASIINKQVNEQSCENAGLDKRNDCNEEVFDRAVLVDEPAGEQQIKSDRQQIKPDNNFDGCINRRMGSECNKEQHADQKDIRTKGSGYGELEFARDTGDIQSKTGTKGIYQPIGIQLNNDRNRQYNSVFLNSKSKSKVSFEESDRFDFINQRRNQSDDETNDDLELNKEEWDEHFDVDEQIGEDDFGYWGEIEFVSDNDELKQAENEELNGQSKKVKSLHKKLLKKSFPIRKRRRLNPVDQAHIIISFCFYKNSNKIN
ncbi:MAG: hypothetical protein EZS28_032756 [Streblomastix strix]|uniref:Uncharacterized protein n=1 Tax=Streblomastix strix TaxID=222440 RepID=A0A5J4UMU7_9EUKA|nr:MAG: hypothetical protein EZS28_032756 [Streblomastix strix]